MGSEYIPTTTNDTIDAQRPERKEWTRPTISTLPMDQTEGAGARGDDGDEAGTS